MALLFVRCTPFVPLEGPEQLWRVNSSRKLFGYIAKKESEESSLCKSKKKMVMVLNGISPSFFDLTRKGSFACELFPM